MSLRCSGPARRAALRPLAALGGTLALALGVLAGIAPQAAAAPIATLAIEAGGTTVSSGTATASAGESITLTLTVSGGTSGGTFSFYSGANLINDKCVPLTTSATTATCVATFNAGTYSILGVWLDGATHAMTSPINLDVSSAPVAVSTTTSIAVSPGSIAQSSTTTLSATVTAAGGGGVPTGTVSFSAGSSPITGCTSVPLDATGTATCPKGGWTAGTYSIYATYYPADSTYTNSTSQGTTLVVSAPPAPVGTTTVMTVSPVTITLGQDVDLQATVTEAGSANPPPDGNVTFDTLNGPLGQVFVTQQALGANGTVDVPAVGGWKQGVYTLQASYAGSDASSSGNAQLTVKAATTTSVTASPTNARLGQSVTFTAKVAVVAPGTGVPTGTVSFTDGSSPISGCTNLTLDATGTATCTTTRLGSGLNSVTASYSGATLYDPSSSSTNPTSVSVTIATTTGLTASTTSADIGQSVGFTAKVAVVAPASGVPTGTVSFTDGSSPISGCTDLTLDATGTATCTTTRLTLGTHEVTATYSGASGLYEPSGSSAVQVTITSAPTTHPLTVTASDETMTYGEAVPALTYTITGFVNGDTSAIVSGSAACSTTATSTSPAGTYPITCTVGTLSAKGYTFGSFVAGTLTVELPPPTITSGPTGTVDLPVATLDFSDAAPGTTFECSLDGATYTACTSPITYGGLLDGSHTFSVVALAASGAVSAPATWGWTVANVDACTGTHHGDLWVPAGHTLLLECNQDGGVHVGPGGALDIEGATVNGSVSSDRATFFRSCTATINGRLRVDDTSGTVTVGEGVASCLGTLVSGSLTMRGNAGSILLVGDVVNGRADLCNNAGTVTQTGDTFHETVACAPDSGSSSSGNGRGGSGGSQGGGDGNQGSGNQGSSDGNQGSGNQGSSASSQGSKGIDLEPTNLVLGNFWLHGGS